MSELKKYIHANGRDSTMTETSLPLEFLNKNDIWYKASDVDAQLQQLERLISEEPRCKTLLPPEFQRMWEACLTLSEKAEFKALMRLWEKAEETWSKEKADFQAQLQPVRWTNEKPTEPGWYWWRKDDLVLAVELVRNILGNLIEEHGDLSADDLVDAEWAGPIAPPLEPPA